MCIINDHTHASASDAHDRTAAHPVVAAFVDDESIPVSRQSSQQPQQHEHEESPSSSTPPSLVPPSSPLSTIAETPPLRRSLFDPSAHRRSASLTFPVSTHRRDYSWLEDSDSGPDSHVATERRSRTVDDRGDDDEPSRPETERGRSEGRPDPDDDDDSAPAVVVERDASPKFGEDEASLIVDFPHNEDGTNDCRNSNDCLSGDGSGDGISDIVPNNADTNNSCSNDEDNNRWDSKGRCVRHPRNRLRKKKLSICKNGRWVKSWEVLMVACPDCCMEELARINSEDEVDSKEGKEKFDKSDKSLPNRESYDNTIASGDSSGEGAVDNDPVKGEGDVAETLAVRSMSLTIRKGHSPMICSLEPECDGDSAVMRALLGDAPSMSTFAMM